MAPDVYLKQYHFYHVQDEFMCVNIVRQKLANLRIILYKECNKSDVNEQSAIWDTFDLFFDLVCHQILLKTFPFKFSLACANWRIILSTMSVPCNLFLFIFIIHHYAKT